MQSDGTAEPIHHRLIAQFPPNFQWQGPGNRRAVKWKTRILSHALRDWKTRKTSLSAPPQSIAETHCQLNLLLNCKPFSHLHQLVRPSIFHRRFFYFCRLQMEMQFTFITFASHVIEMSVSCQGLRKLNGKNQKISPLLSRRQKCQTAGNKLSNFIIAYHSALGNRDFARFFSFSIGQLCWASKAKTMQTSALSGCASVFESEMRRETYETLAW